MVDEYTLIETLNRQKIFLTFENSNPIDEGFNYGIDRAIQLISAQQKIGEWFLVKDKLPEEVGLYLVLVKRSETQSHISLDFYEGTFSESNKRWMAHTNEEVVAWFLHPKPPKLEEV